MDDNYPENCFYCKKPLEGSYTYHYSNPCHLGCSPESVRQKEMTDRFYARGKSDLEKLLEEREPCAVRHSFDGYGWKYSDCGNGSDWFERAMQYDDAEPLYEKY